MHNCNILNNTCTTNDVNHRGTCYSYQATVLIDHCSFFGNSPTKREFSTYNFSTPSSITVKECFFDRENKEGPITSGSITFENISSEYSINQLPHFSTNKCEAEYPMLNDLTLTNGKAVYHRVVPFITACFISIKK